MAEKNIKKLLRAILSPAQDLETTFQALIVNRRVDTATDEHLDVLGRLVAEPRNGLTDDLYRRRIRARIATNNSDGLVEDIIKITHLVVNDDAATVRVTSTGAASVHVVLEDVVINALVANIVMSYLRDAVAAGVRIVFEYMSINPEDAFVMGSATGIAVVGKPFSSTFDPTSGGQLAGSVE